MTTFSDLVQRALDYLQSHTVWCPHVPGYDELWELVYRWPQGLLRTPILPNHREAVPIVMAGVDDAELSLILATMATDQTPLCVTDLMDYNIGGATFSEIARSFVTALVWTNEQVEAMGEDDHRRAIFAQAVGLASWVEYELISDHVTDGLTDLAQVDQWFKLYWGCLETVTKDQALMVINYCQRQGHPV